MERAQLPYINFRYFIISDKQNAVQALAYFQITEFSLPHYRFPFFEWQPLQWLEKRIMASPRQIITCGNLFQANSPGIHFLDGDVQKQAAIIQKILMEISTLYPEAVLILFKDCPANSYSALEKLGYRRYRDEGTMILELPPHWHSFTDYIRSMRHRYAQRIRKARKMLAEIHAHEADLCQLQSHCLRLEQLYKNVVRRQPIRMVWANAAYFVEMKKNLKHRARIFFYWHREQLVAFRTEIVHPNHLELHLIGIDYAFNQKFWLYFNLMYDAVKAAIELQKPALELGRTARFAKQIMGAKPSSSVHFFKVKGVVPRMMTYFLLHWYKKNIRGKASAPPRIFRGQ